MNLNDIKDSDFIGPNEKNVLVTITDIKDCVSNEKGTPGKVLVMEDDQGRTHRHTCWLVETAYFVIKRIANACQLTEDEKGKFELEPPWTGFNMLIGKQLMIDTIADGTYVKIPLNGFHPTDDETVQPPPYKPKPDPNNDVPF